MNVLNILKRKKTMQDYKEVYKIFYQISKAVEPDKELLRFAAIEAMQYYAKKEAEKAVESTDPIDFYDFLIGISDEELKQLEKEAFEELKQLEKEALSVYNAPT